MKSILEIENITIPFQWRHPDLGRAEFSVCVKFKGKLVVEYWVDPIQTELETIWHWRGVTDSLSIESSSGLAPPRVWLVAWCPIHKCPSFKVYCPDKSSQLQLNNYGLCFK